MSFARRTGYRRPVVEFLACTHRDSSAVRHRIGRSAPLLTVTAMASPPLAPQALSAGLQAFPDAKEGLNKSSEM